MPAAPDADGALRGADCIRRARARAPLAGDKAGQGRGLWQSGHGAARKGCGVLTASGAVAMVGGLPVRGWTRT